MQDIRTVYIYVVCALDMSTEEAVEQAKIKTGHIADNILTNLHFHVNRYLLCPNAEESTEDTAELIRKTALEHPRCQNMLPFMHLAQGFVDLIENLINLPFAGMRDKMNKVQEQGLEGMTLAQAMGHFPPLFVLQGALKNLLAQYAMSYNDYLRKGDQQNCNLLFVLPRDMAALACLDMRTVLPQHGDVICYEMRCFPDGSVHLQDSRVLPNNAKP